MPRVLSSGIWATTVSRLGRCALLYQDYNPDIGDFFIERLFVATGLVASGGSIVEMTGLTTFIGDGSTDFAYQLSASGDALTNIGDAGTPDFEVVHSDDGWTTHATGYTAPGPFGWPNRVTGVDADWTDLTKVYVGYNKHDETAPTPPVPYPTSIDENLYASISTDSGASFTEYFLFNITGLQASQTWNYDFFGTLVPYTEYPAVISITTCPRQDGSGFYIYVGVSVPDPEIPGNPHTHHTVTYLVRVDNDGSYVRRQQADGIWFESFYVKQGAPDVSYHLGGTTLTIYDWGSDTYTQDTLPFTQFSLPSLKDQNQDTCFTPDGKFFHFGFSSGYKIWRSSDNLVTWDTLDASTPGDNSWGTTLVTCHDSVLIIPQKDGTFAVSMDYGDTWGFTTALAPDGTLDGYLSLLWAVGY